MRLAGGASGRTKTILMSVTPGNTIAVVVGAGGASASTNTNYDEEDGNAGGATSFNGVSAGGGGGGSGYVSSSRASLAGADGGQGSNAVLDTYAPAMGTTGKISATISGAAIVYQSGKTVSCEAFNPFDYKRYLGAGGSIDAHIDGAPTTGEVETAPTLDDGKSAGDGMIVTGSSDSANSEAPAATGSGNGGGAAAIVVYNGSANTYSAISGAGSNGAVFIYARGV